MNPYNEDFVTINPSCNNERITNDLSKAYNFIKFVPFRYNNVKNYFLNLYRGLKELGVGANFLKDAECISIFYLFQKLLQDPNGNFENQLNVKEIYYSPGYVYQLKIFSLFADYHYLTVVFGDNDIDIYQSYGSSYSLSRKTISFQQFEMCIDILNGIKTRGKHFISDLHAMLYVEQTLYNVNLEDYLIILVNQFGQNDDYIVLEDEEIKDGEKIIQKFQKQYPILLNNIKQRIKQDGMTKYDVIQKLIITFSYIKENYEKNEDLSLIIDEYIPKQHVTTDIETGGKRKFKSKRKSTRKSKSKRKSKRKSTRKNFN